MTMGSMILAGGTRRAVHVYVPTLTERQAKGWKAGEGKCVMAVRSALYDYRKMRLYRKVEILGPSELVEMETPLPGTKGRGVAILFTEHALRVWCDGKARPETIDTSDGDKVASELAKLKPF
jgi:hypothetical protein